MFEVIESEFGEVVAVDFKRPHPEWYKYFVFSTTYPLLRATSKSELKTFRESA